MGKPARPAGAARGSTQRPREPAQRTPADRSRGQVGPDRPDRGLSISSHRAPDRRPSRRGRNGHRRRSRADRGQPDGCSPGVGAPDPHRCDARRRRRQCVVGRHRPVGIPPEFRARGAKHAAGGRNGAVAGRCGRARRRYGAGPGLLPRRHRAAALAAVWHRPGVVGTVPDRLRRGGKAKPRQPPSPARGDVRNRGTRAGHGDQPPNR